MLATPEVPGLSPVTPTSGFIQLDLSHGTKLSVGTRVGEYQIQARIGEGGMGTVYSAIHPIIGKKVAIKVLAGRLAKNKNAIRRFVLEARAVNDIRHPSLVDIFSFGRLTDGRHYYVMEFLDGRDLGDILRERICLPPSEAVPIFIEVSQALVAVHSKGIVHRDLKPENILLLRTPQPGGPRVKLVDFGLAKLIEDVPAHLRDGAPHTAAGVNVGTPHYMSPEQCRGLKVDARADLYALGVVLYETVTGRLPFDGATPLEIWQAHTERPPRPPIEVVHEAVSPALNAVILRLLAKRPEHRFQTAAQLSAALEHVNDGGPPKGTPAPARLGEESDELVSTIEDLPAVQAPSVLSTEEERRREIEELRAHLGLRIEEPAMADRAAEQMSALVIDLGPARASAAESKSAHKGAVHSLPLSAAGARSRPGRHIEERTHVPPLAAPSSRPPSARPPEVAARVAEPKVPARPSLGRILRVAMVVALLVAATVVAIVFVR
jgi:serine/threonine-protein kinase